MYQFFIDQEAQEKREYPIDKATAHHIFKVLRLKNGQEVIVVDSTRQKFSAQLQQQTFLILQKLEENNELPVQITLILAVSSREVLEFSLQKGCELGVHRFLIVGTKFSPTKIKEPEKKLSRWREIVKASAMQSKRNLIPELHLLEFSELSTHHFDLCLVADELATSEQMMTKYLCSDVRNVAVMVGSEGGFHRDEIGQLQDLGFQPVSLAKTTLRTETAVMFALVALVNYFS